MAPTNGVAPDLVQNGGFGPPPARSARSGGAPNTGSSLSTGERLVAWIREYWQITCLVFLFLLIQLYVLTLTDRLVFDEQWWVPEARHILQGEPLPHFIGYTSLGKIFIASGIAIFGDNPWGWRTFSVLFGTLSVVLVYLISENLAGKRTAVLASLLLVTHNLFFALSGLGMLDISLVAFMLLSFALYLRQRYALSGIFLALSVLCKPAGILAVFVILGHWWLTRRKLGFRTVGLFCATAILAFFILMPITDFLVTGQWFTPLGRLRNMLLVQSLPLYPAEAPGSSNPWEWLIVPHGVLTKTRYMFQITPTIWLLTIPSLAYLFYRYFWTTKNRNTARFILLWFAATYLAWIPLTLWSPRPMYVHYFLPTVPAICIAVGYGIHTMWQRSERWPNPRTRRVLRGVILTYLLLHIIIFLALSPLAAGSTEQ